MSLTKSRLKQLKKSDLIILLTDIHAVANLRNHQPTHWPACRRWGADELLQMIDDKIDRATGRLGVK